MEIDPDYALEISQDSIEDADVMRQYENHARESVKNKIRSIIKKQFMEEINAKEKEVALITERLTEARHTLDRLRACVVASYYASSFAKPQEKHTLEPGAAQHPAIQNILRKAATAVLSRNAPHEHSRSTDEVEGEMEQTVDSDGDGDCSESKDIDGVTKIPDSVQDDDHVIKTSQSFEQTPPESLGGRHRIKKKIIVGNVSKYIPPDKREGNDKSTHKWMVYVRGSAEEPRIDHFVRKVWFFLHPSYRPNDLVEVSEAPFHLTRRGWGEFPIRVQLHFCDPRNRRVDIIHNLCLDRTYTGLQTLGSETVCEVELDRSTIDLSVENLLNQPVAHDVTDDVDSESRLFRFQPSPDDEAKSTLELFDSDPSPVIYNLLRDMISTVEDKLKSVHNEEIVSVDSPTPGVEEGDFKLRSPTTERRRKRRRGDSCTFTEAEDDRNFKNSTPMIFLCSGEDKVEGTEESADADSGGSKVNICADSTVSSQITSDKVLTDAIPNLKLSLDEISDDVKSEITSSSAPELKSSKSNQTSLKCSSVTLPSRSVPCSPRDSPAPVTETVPSADRPRSLSVDDIITSTSSSTSPLVHAKKSTGTRETVKIIPGTASSRESSSSVVFYRPRASSTGYPQKFAQTSKGNVTILTPIPSKSVSNMLVGNKRTLGGGGAKVLLNIVPEKQRKLASRSKTGDVTMMQTKVSASSAEAKLSSSWSLSSSGKINLTIAGPKHQECVTSTSGESVQLGTSGSAVMSAKVKVENTSFASKQLVLKNTKQGIFAVSQSSLLKDPIKSSSPTTCGSFQGPADLKKPGDSKSTNQQHLLSMKVLKNAILGGGVGLNRPVQIKVEKPESSFNLLKNNQQFVLTTITNDQGKQQLALVSTDKLKQVAKTKTASSSKPSQVAGCSDAPFPVPVKFEWNNQSASSWHVTKLKDAENLSFYQIIGKRILEHNINDMVADALRLAVRYVPLVASNRNVSFLPFCAKSEAEFLDWNIGKQRAAEMHRASLLQKILTYVKSRCSALERSPVPSKRFLMNWCLARGYSVFTDEFEPADASGDGHSSSVKVQSSMTTCDGLLSEMTEESKAPQQSRLFSSDEIDVVSVTSQACDVKSEPSESVQPCRLQFIHSDAMKAVEEMCQEIDLKLKDVSLNCDEKAPLCHVVLAKALELFTSDLAREMLASALKRRDGKKRILRVLPERIECRDVAEVVMTQDRFQLLSDRHMGASRDSC